MHKPKGIPWLLLPPILAMVAILCRPFFLALSPALRRAIFGDLLVLFVCYLVWTTIRVINANRPKPLTTTESIRVGLGALVVISGVGLMMVAVIYR